jgi:hypothetical protein
MSQPSSLLVNTQNLIFENSGDREDNDRGGNTVYDLIGYRYSFTLKPSTKFWRFGIRMANVTKANFKRYEDTQVKHLEICAGLRSIDGAWRNPEIIQVQQYHFVMPNGTLFSCQKYQENSEVKIVRECTMPGVITLRAASHSEAIYSLRMRNILLYTVGQTAKLLVSSAQLPKNR